MKDYYYYYYSLRLIMKDYYYYYYYSLRLIMKDYYYYYYYSLHLLLTSHQALLTPLAALASLLPALRVRSATSRSARCWTLSNLSDFVEVTARSQPVRTFPHTACPPFSTHGRGTKPLPRSAWCVVVFGGVLVVCSVVTSPLAVLWLSFGGDDASKIGSGIVSTPFAAGSDWLTGRSQ
jgi:hypothetical protein